LGGFIATQHEPKYKDIEELCVKHGFECSLQNQTTIVSGAFFHPIHLKLTSNGVKYKVVLPEYFAYLLILVVVFGLSIVFLTFWQLAIFVALTFLVFLGVKIYYDRILRKVVEKMLPESYFYLPELATEENLQWMTNQNTCPGCGYPNVQYFEICPECGLKIGRRQKVKSPTNATQMVNFIYEYEKDPKNSRKSDIPGNSTAH